jgi:hypothetical protein
MSRSRLDNIGQNGCSQDDSWRLGERYGLARQLLTDEEEHQLAETLRREEIAPKGDHPPKLVGALGQQMRLQPEPDEWDDMSDSWDSSERSEDEKRRRRPGQLIHKSWERFLRQSRLSLRRLHLRRYPKPDDEYLAEFLSPVELWRFLNTRATGS